MQLVECVPNFSEGRDEQIITAIADAARAVHGAAVPHVDSNADANRTVLTIAGSPQAVAEAAYRAIQTAAGLIDMTAHQGAHPRIGATDVCPFVPLEGISLDECTDLARSVGARIGNELRIPAFLYGAAAASSARRSLAYLRRGEYEGLPQRLTDPKFRPDYGPGVFNARSGAIAVGARPLLIAFNVCLGSSNVDAATEIAAKVRENSDTEHSLPGVRAIGWSMPVYGCAQVSMNLTDYIRTPPHVALERVREEAGKLGEKVTGSELIGMLPLEALLVAGKYYWRPAGTGETTGLMQLAQTGLDGLGLEAVRTFDPQQQVLELALSGLTGEIAVWAKTRIDALETQYL